MNIQHLRHSLKVKWLLYYRQNRPWLVRLRIWGTYDGQRRPSSSFILAAVSTLEPQLTQMFPFIIDLSNDPDQIIAALGLNFNPDAELKIVTEPKAVAETNGNENNLTQDVSVGGTNGNENNLTQDVSVGGTNGNGNGLTKDVSVGGTNGNGNGLSTQILPSIAPEVSLSPSTQASNLPAWVDESCKGKGSPNTGLVVSVLAVISALAVVFAEFTG